MSRTECKLAETVLIILAAVSAKVSQHPGLFAFLQSVLKIQDGHPKSRLIFWGKKIYPIPQRFLELFGGKPLSSPTLQPCFVFPFQPTIQINYHWHLSIFRKHSFLHVGFNFSNPWITSSSFPLGVANSSTPSLGVANSSNRLRAWPSQKKKTSYLHPLDTYKAGNRFQSGPATTSLDAIQLDT